MNINSRVPVGVLGASGYVGEELLRLLTRHPGASVVFATAESSAGERREGVDLVRIADAPFPRAEIVLSALPHGVSARYVNEARAAGKRTVDLSADFRLSPEAVYGLTEVTRPRVAAAELVANPGCYPTAALLALLPLAQRGLIDQSREVVIDAASGVTGAGRTPKQELLFGEVAEDFRAYAVGNEHRQLPELLTTLAREGGFAGDLVFTPHLLPVKRGILETIHGRGDLRVRVPRRALRDGDARRAALAQGRRAPEPRRDRGRGRCERATAAAHADHRDRQSGEGRRRTGGPEHERDARPRRNHGARMLSVRVVKLGGNELDRPAWLEACARGLLPLDPVVVVHGGGRAVSAWSERLGLPVGKRDGLRVTTLAVAEVVELVLGGPVNRRVVAALRGAGLDAVGLSGVDGGLLTARPVREAGRAVLGHVGTIAQVRGALLESFLLAGLTPVIAPMAPEGGNGSATPLNVNADEAAAAIAGALRATELLLVSDVPGVQVDGLVQPVLDGADVDSLIEGGEASDGMAVKLRAAAAALRAGARAVRIGDLRLLDDARAGTRILATTAQPA